MSDLKIFTDNIDEKARQQINTLLSQPAFSDCKVRIMPDVHAGAGCVIGFTADLGDKVIPNVVGVDIGCGVQLTVIDKRDIDYSELDYVIRTNVPSGMAVHTSAKYPFDQLRDLYCYEHLRNIPWLENSMGTLGGGNHFIEIDESPDSGQKYLVIHTGSRNLGKQVAEYYQNLAIKRCNGTPKEELQRLIQEKIRDLRAAGRQQEIPAEINALKAEYSYSEKIPNDLCYLTDQDRVDYLHDMDICQQFAVQNRQTITDIICEKMGWFQFYSFSCIHNYISFADNIVRKGAIKANLGKLCLIPINMRDGCIIGFGLGNDDWNCSAPHGAGRIMSRAEARKSIQLDEYLKSMDGIATSTVNLSTIDEAPMAYKSMDEIMKLIEPTVQPYKIIKPVYNFKGSD